MGLRPLEMFYSSNAEIDFRLSESDRRHIRMSKVGPRTERVNLFIIDQMMSKLMPSITPPPRPLA